MKKLEWKSMADSSDRLKVPGGWIVRTYMTHSTGCSIAMVFVSDPTHEWEGPLWPQPDA